MVTSEPSGDSEPFAASIMPPWPRPNRIVLFPPATGKARRAGQQLGPRVYTSNEPSVVNWGWAQSGRGPEPPIAVDSPIAEFQLQRRGAKVNDGGAQWLFGLRAPPAQLSSGREAGAGCDVVVRVPLASCSVRAEVQRRAVP